MGVGLWGRAVGWGCGGGVEWGWTDVWMCVHACVHCTCCVGVL